MALRRRVISPPYLLWTPPPSPLNWAGKVQLTAVREMFLERLFHNRYGILPERMDMSTKRSFYNKYGILIDYQRAVCHVLQTLSAILFHLCQLHFTSQLREVGWGCPEGVGEEGQHGV